MDGLFQNECGHFGSDNQMVSAALNQICGDHGSIDTQLAHVATDQNHPTMRPLQTNGSLSDDHIQNSVQIVIPRAPVNSEPNLDASLCMSPNQTLHQDPISGHDNPVLQRDHAGKQEIDLDLLHLIREEWRRREDIQRARLRIELQAQAICRRYRDGDKEAAGKLWSAIKSNKSDDPLAQVLVPFLTVMSVMTDPQVAVEKKLRKLARQTPLWNAWAKDVKGLGELSFAGLYANAGRPLTDYRGPAALWKRFGLAVIAGERQRKIASADLAELHGYSPQRRAFAFTLSTWLMMAQGTGENAGPYRAVFDRRKIATEGREGWNGMRRQRDAQRIMVKALLKDAWIAARAIP